VQFVFVAENATHVSMAGDFNDWNPNVTPLRRTGAAGVWSVVVPLAPGAYLYAFVVDGDWVADAAAPRASENAFGGPSSIVLVGEDI
jgi:1,4-alpha-glucan branching enzyme